MQLLALTVLWNTVVYVERGNPKNFHSVHVEPVND